MGLKKQERLLESVAPAGAHQLLSLPFDHFQRYQLTQRILDILCPDRPAGRLRVLDVGGSSSSLKHFLPNDEVVLADMQGPPRFTYREGIAFLYDSYFLAVGGHLPFADGSFDVVTAHDTLEHVPERHRRGFLLDLARVTRRHLILNGPMYRPETAWAEKRLALFLRCAFDGSNPSLDEHIELGLPDRMLIEGVLEEEGLPFVTVPNGNLTRWLATMGLKHYLISFPESERSHDELDRTYNDLLSAGDFGGVCYRTAYVASKEPSDIAALQRVVAAFPQPAEAKDTPADIERLDGLLSALEEHASTIRGMLAGQRQELGEQRVELAEQRHAAETLRAALRERERVLIEKDALLGQREVEILQVVAEVSGIRGSLGYRLLEGYRRRIRWLFPPESWRSLPYRALRKAVRLSVDNGRRRAVENQFRRVARVVRKSREIVQREGWRSFASKARRRLISTMKRRPVRASPLSIDYDQWIAANEPDAAELERQREVSLRFPYRPLVSIVVPVWDPPVDTLCEAIESVLSQTYDHWQLCVADGDSKTPVVREHLERFARQDKRVQVKFLEKNLGISGNSNEALAIATGEFVAFLDHTDVLAPNALFEIVQALNRDPRQDCIYSDIDLLSEDGRRRFNPLFKPAWSPDMLLSSNYLAHLCVIRKSCVDELGGLRSETDGAQDWDLLLRLSEMTQRFARVPKVLYHWRADATSAVVSLENKPYAREAQERALREHLERRGLRGAVERDAQSGLRIRWRTTGDIKVSIIIPTKHHRALLGPCLTSIAKSDYKNVEIIVVETAGRSEVREQWYKGFDPGVPFRVLWWDRAFNYSSVNNWAAGQSAGDALLFLNDDTEALAPDWLDEMVGWLEQPGIGVVGARLLAPDGSIQHGGDVLGLEGFAAHMFSGAGQNDWTALGFTNWYRNLLAVTGACLMVRRDTFDTIGGFNEKFVLCGSDVELCLRIHGTGQRVVCTPFAKVLHHERATRGLYDDIQDCFTSFWPYQSHLNRGDPYWSPNLSSHSTIPRLKHPQETTALALVGNVIGRDQTPSAQGAVQIEAEAASLAEACQILPGEVEATRRLHEANSMPLSVKSVNWFVPDFVSPFYGGIHTVFRFADHFKREHGVESRFIVIGTGPEPYVRSGLRTAFPALGDAEIHVCSPNEIDLNALPECDAAIATLWITAYSVSKFQRTKRKFYLVQDFEPGFYPAGTLSALSEATYRLGLYGIANTSTLKAIYESDYGGKAVGFTPCVDTSLFHPPSGPRAEDGALTLFLYGRPGHWRNCYELAIAAIRRLKGRLSKQIRVVTAGSWAASNDAESAYLVDNLGLLDYRATADLYRGCDAGLVLSVSKHPSYLPLELMASGALVVSNVNDAGSWLLRDGVNCLLAEPTAESLCEALERGLTDKALRERLAAQALADIQEGHSDWPSQIEKVFRFMSDPEGSTL